MTSAASNIFGRDHALIGMIHVRALPGTPASGLPMAAIVAQAVDEAHLLVMAGFDGVVIENMHDRPYLRRSVGPEIVAGMTGVAQAVKTVLGDRPLGVQILAGANREALAVANAIGARFIRAEGFVFATVADEGLLDEADAGPLLRYRKAIGADDIAIFADIRKKHSSHALTGDLSISDWAKAAEFSGADGIIVTGDATAEPTSVEHLAEARQACSLPIVTGSGANPSDLASLYQHADAVIVGSWYKKDGLWSNAPDPKRVGELIRAAEAARP